MWTGLYKDPLECHRRDTDFRVMAIYTLFRIHRSYANFRILTLYT
jgi:hypothetical protein